MYSVLLDIFALHYTYNTSVITQIFLERKIYLVAYQCCTHDGRGGWAFETIYLDA